MRSGAEWELRISYEETIDKRAEIARLKKELDRLEKDINAKQERLGDMDFRTRAPQSVVSNLGATMVERQLEHKKLTQRLAELEAGFSESTTL